MKKLRKSLASTLKSEKDVASVWVKKTKEDIELSKWLKKAKAYEKNNDHKSALDAYLSFLELKLQIMKSRSGYSIDDYFKLVPHYIKIGDCYKNIRHYKKESRLADFSKAAEYYKKAARMYMKLEEYPSANTYFELASKTYDEVELYKESADAFKEIADMYSILKNDLIASASYSMVGELYDKADAYDQAYDAYIHSAKLSSSLGDMTSASKNYGNAAEVLRRQGKHGDAINCYVNAAEMGTKLERYGDVARTYMGIAKNYEETNDLDTATRYYIKAADTSRDNDNATAAEAYKNASRCYQLMKKYDLAIESYMKSCVIDKRTHNHAEAAENYWNIAECYISLGRYGDAADSYIEYARYAASDAESKEYIRGYQKAAELYSELGDAWAAEEKFPKAAEFYKKAAKSYKGLNDPMREGEFYFKMGMIEKKNDLGDFFTSFTKAAKKYSEAKDFYNSAECYLEINEYLKASAEFTIFAGNHMNKNDFFNAAEGYKRSGECYSMLSQKDHIIDQYNKANQMYLRYIEGLRKIGVTEDAISNMGEAYFGIAESNRVLDNLVNSKKYFKSAVDYFEDKGIKERMVLSNAFLSLISAKLAIQKGNYSLSGDFLSTSVEKFNEAISFGGFTERYLKFLKSKIKESEKSLDELTKKPEISLTMDQSCYSFVGKPLIINLTVTNHGNLPIKKIMFLSHLPEEIKIIKPLSAIDELAAKQSLTDSLKLSTKKEGEYRIKPLEVLYNDKEGNKYVKSSNIVSLNIVKKPVPEYRNYMDTVNIYQKYADNNLKNKNYFYAGEGYKAAVDCLKEFALRRSMGLEEMNAYCKKAIDAYLQHIDILKDKEGHTKHLRKIADTEFNIADCYEVIDDLEHADKYLSEAIGHYNLVMEKTKSEKEQIIIKSQINVLNAFSYRVRAKRVLGGQGDGNITELFEKSLNLFEEVIKGGWNKDYEDFLKKAQKETRDMLNSIKGKGSAKNKEKAEGSQDTLMQGKTDVSGIDQELNTLLSRRDELEEKIKDVKEKYLNMQLDENQFKTIIEEYRKHLTDTNAKIAALNNEEIKDTE